MRASKAVSRQGVQKKVARMRIIEYRCLKSEFGPLFWKPPHVVKAGRLWDVLAAGLLVGREGLCSFT